MQYILNERLLANRLGVSLSYLWWIATLAHTKSNELYTLIKIPKGNGKFRRVYRVDGKLKFLHGRIKQLLEEELPATGSSYAYEEGASVKLASLRMQGYQVLVSIDFKDHFSSVSMWQVTNMLESHGLRRPVAFLLARLCCITVGTKSYLPQGSVVSPLLSNRVCEHLLDPVLDQAFPGATITRYSDNLYLGFNSKQVTGKDVISKAREIVRMETGWRCHKTRVMPYYKRQRGLGLVLNSEANMPSEKYYAMKALLHNLVTKDVDEQMARARQDFGFEEQTILELVPRLKGQLVYWTQFLTESKATKLNNLMEKLCQKINH